jgi:hypothetical protein
MSKGDRFSNAPLAIHETGFARPENAPRECVLPPGSLRTGPNGVSLAAPSCGIDFLDRQANAAPSEAEAQDTMTGTDIPTTAYRANLLSAEPLTLPPIPSSSRVQTKLLVAPAGDHYEREADRVADEVVQRPNSPLDPSPQKIQRVQPPLVSRRRSGTGGTTVTPEFENSIQAAQGRGHPLASNLRRSMERAFERIVVMLGFIRMLTQTG